MPPPTVNLFGSPFLTWRGLPLVPSDKIPLESTASSKILLLRTGEKKQGVVGLFQPGVPGEVSPSLSVRFMGINRKAIASYLVSLYSSVAVLTEDALGGARQCRGGQVSTEYDHTYAATAVKRSAPALQVSREGVADHVLPASSLLAVRRRSVPLMPELPGSTAPAPTRSNARRLSRARRRIRRWVAAIANSLFKTAPGEPPPSGPGANLPSAPVYAVEPLIAQIPGRFGIGAIGFAQSYARRRRRPWTWCEHSFSPGAWL